VTSSCALNFKSKFCVPKQVLQWSTCGHRCSFFI